VISIKLGYFIKTTKAVHETENGRVEQRLYCELCGITTPYKVKKSHWHILLQLDHGGIR
jgi:hypothetical protein